MTQQEDMISSLELILDLWDVTYDKQDDKYVAKIESFAVLNSEQIGYINKLGLKIFSVQKYEETLIIRFSAEGNLF